MKKLTDTLFGHLNSHYILWSFLAVLLINLCDAGYYVATKNQLFYVDTDCYTRALRIIDWLQDFQWSEKIFPYYNVPNGFAIHFTRICDVIWVVLSLPFMAFEPLKEAIFHGGMLFSPLFFFLTLTCIFWGLRPYAPDLAKKPEIFAVIFFLTILFCVKLENLFDFSRPDHHSVMFFIFCFDIAVILRAAIYPKDNHWYAAGFFTGLGLWASTAVEGLLIAGIILTVLCLQWMFTAFKGHFLMLFSLGLFSGTAFSWLINPPYGGYGVTDTGRLSVVHLVLTALIFLSFAAILYMNPRSKAAKIFALISCALISVLLMFLIFGAPVLLSPAYSETFEETCLPYIAETMPTYYDHWGLYMTGWLSAIFIIGYFLHRGKSELSFSLPLISLLLLTFPLGVMIQRFYQYYLAVFVFGNGLLIFKLSDTLQKGMKTRIVLFIYIVLNLFALAAFRTALQNSIFPEISGNVATDTFEAPRLCFERPVKTISAPYHTNVEGLADNHRLFFSDDEAEIKYLLSKHLIDYVYLPKEAVNHYQNPEKNINKFYGKIITGKSLYPWLEYIPTNTKGDILYKVKYDLF